MHVDKNRVHWGFVIGLLFLLPLVRSEALAYSWATCGPDGGLGSLIIDPTNADHLVYIVGDHRTTYETADGGATWYSLGQIFEDGEALIDLETARYPIVDLITQMGDYPDPFITRYRRSTDGGRTWTRGYDFPLGVHARVIEAYSADSDRFCMCWERISLISRSSRAPMVVTTGHHRVVSWQRMRKALSRTWRSFLESPTGFTSVDGNIMPMTLARICSSGPRTGAPDGPTSRAAFRGCNPRPVPLD